MQQHQTSAAFSIDEARRVLGNAFAPWVHDLNLSVEAIDYEQPKDTGVDWQPGATLRMAFSERLCAWRRYLRASADGARRHPRW